MALTAEQRRRLDQLIALQEEAKALDLAVSVRCTRCGAALSAAKSISKNTGPVCRAKENGPGDSAKNPTRTVISNS